MISLEEARRLILAECVPLPPVAVDLGDALGCVTSIELRADEDVPPFANTAMDGFAVRAVDAVAGARLKIVATLPAGRAPDCDLGAGEAIRIMTGAPMPDGADAVVMVEDTGRVEDILEAILGHAQYCNTPRASQMAKTLFAVDELTGLITATALVRPSKSVHEVDAKSVRKKMKDKAFARGVNREDVINGATELGVDLDDHITFVIAAMQDRADDLGLAGS